MPNVKLDPDPSPSTVCGVKNSGLTLTVPSRHTPLASGSGILRRNHPPTDQSSHRTCIPSTTQPHRGLRPIAPKPFHKKNRKRSVPESSLRPPVFVSFSLYGQCLAEVSESVLEERSRYATTVIPRKQLRVLGRNTLRLHTVIPRSRLSSNTMLHIHDVESAPDSDAKKSVSGYRPPLWTCSHRTVLPFNPYPNESPQPCSTFQSTGPVLESKSPGEGDAVSYKRLRPTARLLVRLGRQLTRTQFARMATNECACGRCVMPLETTDHVANQAEPAPDPPAGQFSSLDSMVATRESTHLEWRPKPSHPRWTRVRELCKGQRCPFIPSSIFQLHRHLELGHQRYVRLFRNDVGVVPQDRRSGAKSKGDPSQSQDTVEPPLSRLYAPLVVNCNSSLTLRQCCPVCISRRGCASTILSHIKNFHPFISAQPLEKPTTRSCAVCGVLTAYPARSARVGLTASGAVIHHKCSASKTAYQHAAWGAFDAHPLACLILFPNQHSRLALPADVASQLYRSLDFVVSNKLRTAASLDSYSLRCSLTISAIFGDLVILELKGQVASASTVVAIEEGGETQSNIPVPEIPNAATFANLRSLVPPPQVSLSSEAPILSTLAGGFVIPSVATSAATCLFTNHANSPQPDTISGSKRIHTPSPDTAIPSKRISVGRTETERQDVIVIPNGDSSDHPFPNSSGEQNKHRPTRDAGARSVPSELGRLGESPATPPLNSQTHHNSLSVIDTPCEMCHATVPTLRHRSHLQIVHGLKLPPKPSDPCVSCGQLFWTVDGLVKHRSIRCEFCQDTVCQSTLYLHMALHHVEALCTRLTKAPKQCLICNAPQDNLALHLSNKHFCSIPMDVLDRLKTEGRKVDTSLEQSSGVSLHELGPLYIKSQSNHRDLWPGANTVAEHVISRDPIDAQFSVFRCCVCHLKFISNFQLDMHVLQSGHRYCCTGCPFTCTRLAALVSHILSCSKKKPSFRFIRLGNGIAPPSATVTTTTTTVSTPTNLVTPAIPSSLPLVATTSVVSEQAAVPNIRRAVGPVSQFHGCDLCPVFCLRLEELDTHRQTVHNCPPLLKVPVTTTATTLSIPLTSLTPAVPQTVTTAVIATTQPYIPQPPPSFLPRRRVVSQVTPGRALCPSVASSGPIIQTQPITSIVIVPRPLVPPPRLPAPTSRPIAPRIPAPVRGPKPQTEEFVCPLCEFHSSSRSVVMQHLTETH
ncbi:hypothetical protein CLF_111056 [Clonorchis sinensis]|uniref:C2H2-type domain-containing protein n=1 Tax=Clonorchis sinensis TaxID=79923 RepID=G7YU95_CLOSI|nr:hypothetical protein CLF_111056 [Clonorchis sinensis]